MKYLFTIIFLIAIIIPAYAQIDSTVLKTEEILDDVLIEAESESEDEDLYDYLEEIIANPIDLNKADIFELTKIPGMDNVSAEKIIKHREKFGNFYSTNELFAIRDLNKNLIEKIIPFLKVENKFDQPQFSESDESTTPFYSKLRTTLRSRISNDLQTRRGFSNQRFAGSKIKTYNRLQIKYDKYYQAGVLIEKDPGEVLHTDFSSFHFQMKDVGFINNLIIGDYTIELGQGLALWGPFSFSKGADAVFPVKKSSRFIRPYTSAAEYNFFRGAASTFQFGSFRLSGFYSNHFIDASINEATNEIISFSQTGFHRTTTEIAKKNSAQQIFYGGSLDYRTANVFNIGAVYYKVKFDKPLEYGSLYDVTGDNFNYLSVYYNLNYYKFSLFGEASYDLTSVASLNGLQFAASDNLIFTTAIRSYPRNYKNLFGFGFGERSGKTNNEVGFYSGVKLRTKIGILNLYYDIFKFPFKTNENSLSSEGDELLIDFLANLNHNFEIKLRYKYENKEITEIIDNESMIVRRLKQTARTELIYETENFIRLKTRIEYNNFLVRLADKNENGLLIFQEARLLLLKKLAVYGRIIFFHTDSFNSAVYEFENDLMGVMPNLAMYGKGIRWYFLIRYKPNNLITISAKYSETYKPDETSLSSGDNTIIGNLDNRFSLQIDITL
ncbi:MAG: helix-hairpin-helix domain-containing protein [Ignavibacterium sp.]|nr:helix-hairpin-helix domain-containing protein [Ignavibacterium sp.]